MEQPRPIIILDLFPEILEALLSLLASLTPQEWEKPTACPGWSARDVALHLLGDDIGILSRKRDGHVIAGSVSDWGELVELVNELNSQWVRATRRISPRLLVELLGIFGAQVHEYFRSLDLYALGSPVSWAGPEAAPVWLDVAREYTERWLHQQHIRDAVAKAGLKEPRYLKPVLDTFVRALPVTYQDTPAADGTLVALNISGESGARWSLLREGGQWTLYQGAPQSAHAGVLMPEDIAWRVFTRGMDRAEALDRVTLTGDLALAAKLLDTVSIIA